MIVALFCTFLFSLFLCSSQQPLNFPSGFLFGSATASYQVEGAYKDEGRGYTIWDAFTHAGRCHDNDTGDIADDHYHRVTEDIAVMTDIGFKVYRMSLAWSRIFPTGAPPLNQAGVDHYNNEINLLIKAGITPFVTLFHWDLPSLLEVEYGDGWLRPETSDAFAVYADKCFELFGDRVKHWFTLNEPHTVAVNGYESGSHAPGRCSDRSVCPTGDSGTEPYIAAHNMLLAHAKAVNVYRTKYQKQQQGVITIVLDSTWAEPYSNSSDDLAASDRQMEFYAGWFADPVFKGDYPDSMKHFVGSRLPQFTTAEKALLKGSADFYSLNHYTSRYVQNNPNPTILGPSYDSHVNNLIERDGQLIGLAADSPWLYVVPYGIKKNLYWLQARYGDIDFWISENGVDVPDESSIPFPQVLQDPFRVDYYHDYLAQLSEAIYVQKVKVRGYFAWSLMDNFEWNDGYSKRFGIHYVDYNTLNRYQKDSAKFFKMLVHTCCK